MHAIVKKLSGTGKTMLVQVQMNKYDIGFTFAWCANPDGLKKDAVVEGFAPTGVAPVGNGKDGKPLLHKDGNPVMKWVF